MTTITIERAFLIKVLNQIDIAQSLLERSQHHAKMAAVYEELRAALSAPATAPEQPAWQAATNAALERAALEVEKIDRLFYFRTQQDIAQGCTKAIRALKDSP
jgi:hypothetical protein